MARDPGDDHPGVTPATVADLDAIVAIEQHGFATPRPREVFARELTLPHARLVVLRARSAGPVVGFANFWVQADEVDLHVIAVAPDQRRRGLGAILLAHVLAVAAGGRVTLEVRASNAPAQALYRRAGFGVDGRRPRYYPDGEDAVLMSRAPTASR